MPMNELGYGDDAALGDANVILGVGLARPCRVLYVGRVHAKA